MTTETIDEPPQSDAQPTPWTAPHDRDANLAEALIGSWRFGRAVSGDDPASRRACARNLAPDAQNRWLDRLITGGPIVNDDSFTFQNGVDALTTQITEPREFTLYLVARTLATGLGSAPSDRVAYSGWFGAAAARGSMVMAYSQGALRALSYENLTTPAIAANELPISDGLAPWRIIALRATARELELVDLTEGTEAGPTTLSGGRARGPNRFRIGGVYATYRGKSVEIHAAALYAADHPRERRAAVADGFRASFEGTSIEA